MAIQAFDHHFPAEQPFSHQINQAVPVYPGNVMHVDLHFSPLGLALLLPTGACALRIFYALGPFTAAEKKLPKG
jgi:hypothetical protein